MHYAKSWDELLLRRMKETGNEKEYGARITTAGLFDELLIVSGTEAFSIEERLATNNNWPHDCSAYSVDCRGLFQKVYFISTADKDEKSSVHTMKFPG